MGIFTRRPPTVLPQEPKEYSPEHFEDPLHHQIKEPWWSKLSQDKKKLFIIGGVIVVAVILLIIWGVVGNRTPNFSGKRVFLEIEAPSAAISGTEVTYRINCVNREEVALKQAEVELTFPTNFEFKESSLESSNQRVWDMGRIAKNASRDFTVTGTLTGVADESRTITGTLRYQPEGINSTFEVEESAVTVISAGDLVLTVDAPQTSSSGNEVEYLVRYENRGSSEMKNLELHLTYPDGFTFSSALPSPTSDNNLWATASVAGGAREEVKIKGTLTGNNNEAKRVTAELGTRDAGGQFYTLLREEDSTRVMQSAVVIMVTLNDKIELNVDPAQALHFHISYENQGGVALKNASVILELDTALIDFSKFETNGGFYQEGKVTWTSSGVPALALLQPAQRGSIDLTTKVKGRAELPVQTAADKNFKIVATARLQSDDIPVDISANHQIASEPVVAQLNTFLELAVRGLYYEQFTGQPVGSGPIPPRVNQKTTYRFSIEVKNFTNDVEDAKVICALAPGITYERNDSVTHGQDLEYDAKTGIITWTIGRIPANTGSLSEKMVASFNIGMIPGEDKVGQTVTLVKETTIEGKDSFTSTALHGTVGELTTVLKEDKFMKETDGKVQP